MSSIAYAEVPFTFIKEKVGQNFVLVVTATKTETNHLHAHLKPIDSGNKIYKVYKNSITYFIGVLGRYKIIHVQCGMGAVSRDAAITTIANTLNTIESKVVIMVGIAFGINNEKQKIGDVLISETILPYEFTRVGKKTVYRSSHAYASKVLINRFKNNQGWEHKLPNGETSEIITGHILSGEKLIDNIKFRNQLVSSFPQASGGEMEGAGLFAACDGNADWILIKGICDFADGEKNKNKDLYQSTAIEAAIAASMILFDSDYSFDGLDIFPISESIAPPTNFSADLSKLLTPKTLTNLPTSPTLVSEIVEEIINDSNAPTKMLKQIQDLVKAFLSLTEVDKIGIAKKLNLESANMIEIPGHTRDKVIFSEIKSKDLLPDLWDEVFKHKAPHSEINPFKKQKS